MDRELEEVINPTRHWSLVQVSTQEVIMKVLGVWEVELRVTISLKEVFITVTIVLTLALHTARYQWAVS